jgi:hypothetical protein
MARVVVGKHNEENRNSIHFTQYEVCSSDSDVVFAFWMPPGASKNKLSDTTYFPNPVSSRISNRIEHRLPMAHHPRYRYSLQPGVVDYLLLTISTVTI